MLEADAKLQKGVETASDLPAIVVGDNLVDGFDLRHCTGQRVAILHQRHQLPPLHPPAHILL